MPLYPSCALWVPGQGITAGEFDRDWPSAPVLILAAGRDDDDVTQGGADCAAWLDAIPGGRPARAAARLPPRHAWLGRRRAALGP